MKKILAASMAVLMLCLISLQAFATDSSVPNENFLSEIDLDVMTSDLTYTAIDSSKYTKIEVGNYIPAHVWDGTNLISSDKEILFFPIYGDDNIVAILTMFNPLGEKSYTVGVDFAPELNRVVANGAQNIFIVEAGSKIFLHSNGDVTLLKQYGKPEFVDAEALRAYTDNKIQDTTKGVLGKPVPAVDSVPAGTSGISSDYYVANSLTASELKSFIGNAPNSFTYFSESITSRADNTATNRLDITPTSNRQTRAIQYLRIGTANQGATERCTFYATSLIGNYLSTNNYTPQDLVDEVGQEMGNIDNAQYLLGNLYGQDYSFVNDIYGRDANMFIDEGWPLYAAFYDAGWDKGHALAVCGYDGAGNSGIYVSETLTGKYKAIYPNSSSQYITRAYSVNCYWSQTLFHQYW